MPYHSSFNKKPLSITITHILAAWAMTPAHAATIFVAPGVAEGTTDGQCSLVEAIQNANNDAATNPDCIAGDQEDEIRLAANSIYTLTASNFGDSGTPVITSDITFSGGGSTITRSLDQNTDPFRIFTVNESASVFFNDLTISNGRNDFEQGAGIRNEGTAYLTRVSVTGNYSRSGGGIMNEGPTANLTITDSTISGNTAIGNGGGISNYNYASLYMVNSTVSGNSAVEGRGGGIESVEGGAITLQNVTLAGNGAATGGGLYHADNTAAANLTNTLIADSTKGGDCIIDSSVFSTNQSNLVEDGSCSPSTSGDPGLGALADNDGATLTHAIPEDSIARDNGDNASCPAEDQRGSFRIDGRCDQGAYEGYFDPGPIMVDPGAVVEGDDGQCSLIEAIRNANDDVANLAGGNECESGFEGADEIVLATGAVYTLTDVDNTLLGPSALPAIESPILLTGRGATIERSSEALTPDFRFFINSTGPLILSDLTLQNGSAGGGGAAYNQGFGDLTLDSVTLTGNAADDGGAILSGGSLTIRNSTFSANRATNEGGAIWAFNRVEVRNSTFAANEAAAGSAVFGEGGTLTLLNTLMADGQGSGELCELRNGMIGANSRSNLVEDGSCSPSVSGDPNLGPLQDNGGFTHTHGLQEGSIAQNAGDSAECASIDQRGAARLDGSCDIGAFEGPADRGPIFVDLPQDGRAQGQSEDGLCSLSEAINNANTDTRQFTVDGECELGLGPDEIVLPKSGVIEFTRPAPGTFGSFALPTLRSEITITGNDASLVRSSEPGTDSFGFFAVGGPVTLNGLTIRNGRRSKYGLGGAIFNYDTLQVNNSSFTGNYADVGGAIWSLVGEVTISHSTISGNTAAREGGGIWTGLGSATINNSTIANNTASSGGGIYAYGYSGFTSSVALTNSTISGNVAVASENAGRFDPIRLDALPPNLAAIPEIRGFSDPGSGGGVALSFSYREVSADLKNVTLANNQAALGSGIALGRGTATIQNSLITDGSGGGADCDLGEGTFSNNNSNFIGDGSCNPLFSGNPNLGPLGSNGGPTQTHALLYPSDAIDGGDNGICPDMDQRGAERDTQCDIGAYEFVNTAPILLADAFMVSDAARTGDEVGTLETQDAENNVPTQGAYQILSGNVGGAFAVENDGTITVANDAALTQDFTLIIQVTDAGGLSATAAVSIQVLIGDLAFRDGFELIDSG